MFLFGSKGTRGTMAEKLPVDSPGRYVAPTALGFAGAQGELVLVTSTAPLPVTFSETQSAPPQPLSGRAVQSVIAGPYVPVPGQPIHLQLSGTWQGTVVLERSIDGGATRQGLTVGGGEWAVFTGNANEQVWQEGDAAASFWLNLQIASGEIVYRVSQ